MERISVSPKALAGLENQIAAITPESSVEQKVDLAIALVRNRFPTLARVEVISDPSKLPSWFTGLASWQHPGEKYPNSRVLLSPREGVDQFVQLDVAMRIIAERIGVNLDTFKSSRELVALFGLFHEFGHARFYFQTIVKFAGPMAPDIANVCTKNDLLYLPIPNHAPSDLLLLKQLGGLESLFSFYAEELAEKGIYSAEQLLVAQQIAYRDLPLEEDADRFAAQCFNMFWDLLGLPPRPNTEPESTPITP